jgi:nitrite reductase (NADH) small subunit
MAERILGPADQIPKGEGRVFEVDGLRVAVFHTRGGGIFATQAECPHRQGPLADGLTDENTVVCPLHDRVYDLRTGQELGADCALSVYPIRVDASGIMLIGLDSGP